MNRGQYQAHSKGLSSVGPAQLYKKRPPDAVTSLAAQQLRWDCACENGPAATHRVINLMTLMDPE